MCQKVDKSGALLLNKSSAYDVADRSGRPEIGSRFCGDQHKPLTF